jgi:hypothetical protein
MSRVVAVATRLVVAGEGVDAAAECDDQLEADPAAALGPVVRMGVCSTPELGVLPAGTESLAVLEDIDEASG